MVGTLCLGPLADRIGRRPVFMIAASIICFFGMLLAACASYMAALCAIFCVGFGVGGLTIPFDILAEFLPARGRGTNLLLIEYFWTVGCLYVVAVAYFSLHGEDAQWRRFVRLCSLPCVAALVIGYAFVPESARWLSSRGRCQEALQVLRKAAKINGLNVEDIFPEGIELVHENHGLEATVYDLFRPEWKAITLRLWGTWCGFAFGYYGAILTITKVFKSTNNAPSSTSSYSFDYSAIFVSSSAELLGTTLVILAIDRAGRIPCQVVSYIAAGVSICLLGILSETDIARVVLVALGFLTRVFEMSGTCSTWVGTAEILSTDLRTTGHSAANAVARIGAFVSPFVIADNSPRIIGLVMLFVHLFTAMCVSKLPETKGKHMGASNEDDGNEIDLLGDEDAVDSAHTIS
jgi:MFS family permease